ncbi:hypothetical protein [Streptococcus sp. 20-1249]|uniref:hypothetical protein n=1 Tax=Streptococcus hepaticus TaxID=3349163 RepID=UPI001C94D926
MSINDQKIVNVHSRSEAEVAVYKSLPYKANFALSTGHSFSMDMRLLGLSYFSKTELKSLDKISNTNLWNKFSPFFETKQNQLLSIYSKRLFWLQSLEKSIQNFPDLLKQEPETNHLIVNPDNQMTISAPVDGYEIQSQNFIAVAQNISKTAQFEHIPLEANLISAEDQSWNLSQYTQFIDKIELPLSDSAVQKYNQELAFHKLQNVYIAAGQSVNFLDVIGKLNKKSGYLRSVIDGKEIYGSGVELVVDALQSLTFKHMKVNSYKGKAFNIGDPGKEFTQLSVTNTSQNDVVLSLSKEDSQLTIVLASK